MAGNFIGTDDAHHLADKFFGSGLELFNNRGFEVVGLDNTVAGEGFVHQVGQFGIVRLHSTGGFADFASIDDDRHQAQRKNHDGHERERWLHGKLVDNQANDGNRVFDG